MMPDHSIYFTTFAAALDSITQFCLMILFYVGPFFFIPMLMQRAGGMFSALSGAVNDKSKGLFDRNRNWRGNKRKQLNERAKAGKRFAGDGKFADAMNKASLYGSNFSGENAGLGINPRTWSPKRIASNMRANVGGTQTLENAKKFMQSAEGQAALADEAVSAAAVKWTSDVEVHAKLEAYAKEKFEKAWSSNPLNANKNKAERETAEKAYVKDDADRNFALLKRARRTVGGEAFDVAAVISAAGTSSGHSFEYRKDATGTWQKVDTAGLGKDDDPSKGNSITQMIKSINEVTGGDDMLRARVISEARGAGSKAGRSELGGGSFGTTVGIATSMASGGLSQEQASQALLTNFVDGTHGQTAVYGKKGGLELYVKGTKQAVERTTNEDAVDAGLAKLASTLDMAAQATGDNAGIIAKTLRDSFEKEGTTIQGAIEKRYRNPKKAPQFNAIRRDLAPGHPHFTGENDGRELTPAELEAASRGTPTSAEVSSGPSITPGTSPR